MRAVVIDAVRDRIVQQIAHGSDPGEILEDLCRAYEAHSQGPRAGVTVLDPVANGEPGAGAPGVAAHTGGVSPPRGGVTAPGG